MKNTCFVSRAFSNGMLGLALSGLAWSSLAANTPPTQPSVKLEKIGGFKHAGGQSSAEITAYDAKSRQLFVVNGALGSLDVLDLSKPSQPQLITSIKSQDLWAEAGGINSVAVRHGWVALAIEAKNKTQPGQVVLLRVSDRTIVASAAVGALPDMLTFSADGRWLLVANEGEPNSYLQADSVDPEGSISIIDLKGFKAASSPAVLKVRTADFTRFNAQRQALLEAGVRLFGPKASVAQDLEPEYIAIAPDQRTAYVTLQENNAIATLDIASARVTAIHPLGYKNHHHLGQGIDASDKDKAVNVQTWPVFGMYQPDAVASFQVKGKTYLITANEGDAREYPGFNEEVRVKDLPLNDKLKPYSGDAQLGRLTVTRTLGSSDGGKTYDQLYAFGARSFSIWDSSLRQVYDSGDAFEQLTQALPNVAFNASNSKNQMDDRSDNKGPEPEGVAVARMGQRTYAFIGLERVGGVMVYDVSNPAQPRFAGYTNTRQGGEGDLGPEGIEFISAQDSPIGQPLLVTGNEASGTTAIYRIHISE